MNGYKEEILALGSPRMADIVRVAARRVPPEYRTRPWSHPELNHGVGILSTDDALNCYLAAYGIAHVAKMRLALRHTRPELIDVPFEVVDWGCGQALASICLADRLREVGGQYPRAIQLVDASGAALRRASLHCHVAFGEKTELYTLNGLLPAPGRSWPRHFIQPKAPVVVHMISNILDIKTIGIKELAQEILSIEGEGIVICCSPEFTYTSFVDKFCSFFCAEEIFSCRDRSFYTNSTGHTFGCDIAVFKIGSRPHAERKSVPSQANLSGLSAPSSSASRQSPDCACSVDSALRTDRSNGSSSASSGRQASRIGLSSLHSSASPFSASSCLSGALSTAFSTEGLEKESYMPTARQDWVSPSEDAWKTEARAEESRIFQDSQGFVPCQEDAACACPEQPTLDGSSTTQGGEEAERHLPPRPESPVVEKEKGQEHGTGLAPDVPSCAPCPEIPSFGGQERQNQPLPAEPLAAKTPSPDPLLMENGSGQAIGETQVSETAEEEASPAGGEDLSDSSLCLPSSPPVFLTAQASGSAIEPSASTASSPASSFSSCNADLNGREGVEAHAEDTEPVALQASGASSDGEQEGQEPSTPPFLTPATQAVEEGGNVPACPSPIPPLQEGAGASAEPEKLPESPSPAGSSAEIPSTPPAGEGQKPADPSGDSSSDELEGRDASEPGIVGMLRRLFLKNTR